MKRVIITSGYFNPLHIGHINLFREAKKLGDHLVVIVNNDEQVRIKGSVPFMKESERLELIKSIRHVDEVFLSVDKDGFQPQSLKAIAEKYPECEYVFAKGGDREFDNLPESERTACKAFNIEIKNKIGGDKIQSSSWLIKKASES